MQNWSKPGVNIFFTFQIMSKKLNLDDFFRLSGHCITARKAADISDGFWCVISKRVDQFSYKFHR